MFCSVTDQGAGTFSTCQWTGGWKSLISKVTRIGLKRHCNTQLRRRGGRLRLFEEEKLEPSSLAARVKIEETSAR